ncbi:LOW QUALITY PROTEIN: uncharacterized protein ACR2FA_006495 [Aphomia sociella]
MSNPEKILCKLLDDIVEERKYKKPTVNVKPISTGGANYTSVLFLVTVSEPGNEDLQLFAKVGVVGEKMRSQMPILMFDIERYAYTELLKKYEELQNNHTIPDKERLRIPKFYGCNPTLYEETIVLEDLIAKGFTTYDRLKSIDWDYASKSVESLAKFHALSLAYSHNNPEEYEKVVKKLIFQEETFTTVLGQMFENIKKKILLVASDKNKSRVEKYLHSVDVKNILSYYKPERQNIQVLCHGDYRPSNLLHKVEKDGTLNVIPVDFQTIYSGSPLLDLMYFIFTGSDEHFRRRHFWDLVDHYYRELCTALRNLGLDTHKLYPKDDFDHDVKEFLPFGFIIGCFLLPLITVNAEDAPSPGGNNDIKSFMNIKTSSYYPDRLNGIINDFLNYEKLSVDIKSISTSGANYTSSLYTATVSEAGKEDLHLFAKVAVFGEKVRAQIPFDVFDMERLIYEELLSKYKNLQDKHDVPQEKRLVMPKLYGFDPKEFEETIVFENLMVKGFTTYDRFKSIDWNYASKAVESLAKLHALSMAFKEESPEEFNQFLDKTSILSEMYNNLLNVFFEPRVQSTIAVTSEKNKSKVKKYIDDQLNQESHRKVLCHGDYRPSNLMHRINEKGVLEVVPVDYQTIQSNSPITDLLYLIFTGSDEKFRRQYFQQLIEHYYEELSSALRRFKMNPDMVYPKRDFELDLKEYLPYGLMIAIFGLPLITVEEEDAPSMQNANGLESFTQANTGSLYPERMNGVLNDFIRWGIIE